MALALEILIATQDRSDLAFLKYMFPAGHDEFNLLIINQTTEDNFIDEKSLPGNVRVINSLERGLSKSRNLALRYASKDVLLLADDDVRYEEGFHQTVLKGHEQYPSAVLIFPIKDENGRYLGAYPGDTKSMDDFWDVFSPQISIKLKYWARNPVFFDENFGLGAPYPDAENFIFLNELKDRKTDILFINTEPIAMHPRSNSSAFLERDSNFKTRLMIIKKYRPHLLWPYFFKLLFSLWIRNRISVGDFGRKWRIFKEVLSGKG